MPYEDSLFIGNRIYVLKNAGTYDYIFVCLPTHNNLGKLVQYKTDRYNKTATNIIYHKTGIQYFLNCYNDGDIKQLFLNRSNYDCIGQIGVNYYFSSNQDDTFIITNLDMTSLNSDVEIIKTSGRDISLNVEANQELEDSNVKDYNDDV